MIEIKFFVPFLLLCSGNVECRVFFSGEIAKVEVSEIYYVYYLSYLYDCFYFTKT